MPSCLTFFRLVSLLLSNSLIRASRDVRMTLLCGHDRIADMSDPIIACKGSITIIIDSVPTWRVRCDIVLFDQARTEGA